jgi:hypothetical protein
VSDVLVLRLLEHIHGHLGWLVVAALLHPAILLRNPKRRARLSVVLCVAMLAATAAIGAYIYPEYRSRIKQHIFIEQPQIGWLFERKEHLAVGALAFALAGCIAHLLAPRFADEGLRRQVALLAHRAFVVALLLAVVVASLGLAVATYRTF